MKPVSTKLQNEQEESARTGLCLTDETAVYYARINQKLPRKKKETTLIDLFSGAGGLTLGFGGAFGHSFQPVWANDFNPYAAASYNANFGNHCSVGNIVNILKDKSIEIPPADLVIGGPPCQGFSLLNKNRLDDPRKRLWVPFFEVVKRAGAQIFVMENVPQLLGSHEYFHIVATANELGFQIADAKLCAANYGVSQTRWRAFIIGCRFADPNSVFPPKKTHWNPANGDSNILFDNQSEYVPDARSWRVVRDAIGDLPSPCGTAVRNVLPPMNLHFGRMPTAMSLKRYRAIPKEGMNRFDLQSRAPELTPACWIRKEKGGTDLFGRLWWDRPAFTIRTEFFKPEKGRYLHPSAHRPITHREAARLQSFPDSFVFIGTKIEIAKQIGNAVPPMLAARIADCVYALFEMRK
ncbi:MAG: DNA cytosine methyltransferase [candidate division Zixibacteria bacterium]|nr:DNA cytosine methyltransferase [candidate division Zixibacteria bacterium]